jgi:hypothetical protein
MPGVFGKGMASIGGMTNKLLKGSSGYNAAIRATRGSMPVGMRGSIADTAYQMNLKTGRKVAGAGIGIAGMGMANRSGSGARGGYQPRRSVVPVPQNGMPM